MTQHELSLVGALYSSLTGTPHVLFLHGYEFTADGEHVSSLRRGVVEWILREADVVIANSHHVAETYGDDVVDGVVYPFVDERRYRVEADGDSIHHVTATKRKGIEVTLNIAERLPDREFTVVGQADSDVVSRMERQQNVTYRGFVSDMTQVYADSRLVLMPSEWAEPYGMVPVEAGVSGIPTVASGGGGLREAVGCDELPRPVERPGRVRHENPASPFRIRPL